MRVDGLSSVVRCSSERRTTQHSLSRRIMRLVPVFIPETNNQTNNKCLSKFVQTDNAYSSIKTGNLTTLILIVAFLFVIVTLPVGIERSVGLDHSQIT